MTAPTWSRAIAIRELTPAEQVLSHGIPVSQRGVRAAGCAGAGVPICRAADGYGLLRSAARRPRPLTLPCAGRGAPADGRPSVLLAGLAVQPLTQQVGVPVVPGVLLDHVDEHPAAASRPRPTWPGDR